MRNLHSELKVLQRRVRFSFRVRISYIPGLLLLLFNSGFCHATNLTLSLANNPNPEINSDTLMTSTAFSTAFSTGLQLTMIHHFQKKGGERTESAELNISGGTPHTLLYQIGHGFGHNSNYFSNSSTRIQLLKRLEHTPASGFYEYNEDNYGFGTYRRAEFGPGYRWMNSFFYTGARMEKAGGSNISFLFLVSVHHQFRYIVGDIQATLYGGPQFVFDDAIANDAEFGYRVKIKGQWLPPGLPPNMQLKYALNGLLIDRTAGVYRRFGAEIGLIMEY